MDKKAKKVVQSSRIGMPKEKSHQIRLNFERKIASLLASVFENTSITVYNSTKYEAKGKYREWFLVKRGEYTTPDLHLVGRNIHIPIEIKVLRAERGKKLLERFKQREAPDTGRYVGGRLYVKGSKERFVDIGAPASEKAIMITNANFPQRTVDLVFRKHGVHTISIDNLESIVEHLPDLTEEEKPRIIGILSQEKKKIKEEFSQFF